MTQTQRFAYLPSLAPPEPTWRGAAECRRDNAVHFFAPSHFERKEEKDLREGQARALCRACPVQKACLEYSLAVQEPHGIWGGLNELERRRTLRKRAAEGQQRSA
jgi:WhiB family redox-sensing transcriptional regulator